jgi:exodeoxyribonuclease-3
VKIATWNVNGIRARHGQLLEWIDRERPDVVCLQEIKAAPDQIPLGLSEIDGYWSYWHGGKGYSGVALHVSRTFAPERPVFSHPDFDFEHRIVQAESSGVIVASIYVPNGGKDFAAKIRFLEALDEYAASLCAKDTSVVLCGDLNIARTDIDVHVKERKLRAIGQLPEERALLERMLGHGFVDVGRALDPENGGLFTWWPPWRNMRERNIGWRIDYVLASQTLAARAVTCPVQRDVGTSDHAPVVANFV